MNKFILILSFIPFLSYSASESSESLQEASRARIAKIEELHRKYVESYMQSYEKMLMESSIESLKMAERTFSSVAHITPIKTKKDDKARKRQERLLDQHKEFIKISHAASMERMLKTAIEFANERIDREIKSGLI